MQEHNLGTDLTGKSAGPGNLYGVFIDSGSQNTIGGTAAGAGNLISGNTGVGVYILGSPSTGNVVTGNLIGLAPDGIQRLPNPTGVYTENAPGNVIGGASSAAANVISANSSVCVYILGGQSVGNVVEGNLIGSNIVGGCAGNGITSARKLLTNRSYGVSYHLCSG